VSQSRISKIEDGILLDLDAPEISKLAAALSYPTSFFFGQRAIRHTCVSLYRKRTTVPAKTLRVCDAKIKLISLHIQRLLEAAEVADERLPFLPADESDGG